MFGPFLRSSYIVTPRYFADGTLKKYIAMKVVFQFKMTFASGHMNDPIFGGINAYVPVFDFNGSNCSRSKL